MRGWLTTTTALTIAMLLLVLLTNFRSQPGSGRSPAPFVSHITAADRLPDGAVELVALSTHPSDSTWWKPDGSPWTDEPFENPGRRAGAKADHRGVEMVFRTPGIIDPNPSCKYILTGSAGSSGGRLADQNGEPVENTHFIAALFPEDLTETTVRVRVAHGEWETLADQETGSQANLGMVRQGRPIRITFVGADQNANGDAVLKVAHDIVHAEVRLVAVDQGGNEQRCSQASTSGGQVTATFEGIPLAEIDRIRLKTRRYRWAEFENVQLEPRAGGVDSGVRVTFDDVSLEDGDGGQRLDFHYTRNSDGAKLGWKTDGRFRKAGVDLLESTSVVAGARVDEPAAYRYRVSIALPEDMPAKDLAMILADARRRWKGNGLVVYPGDEYPVATLRQSSGHEVTLSIVGRPGKGDRSPPR